MPEMIMLVGIPGTGKSTWVNEQDFFNRSNWMVLSTDNFVESVALGEGKTYSDVFNIPGVMIQAEKNLHEGLEYAISRNMNIVWDQTNLTAKTRKRKLDKIPAHYRKTARVFPVPKTHDAWLNSPERSGKIIPDKVIANMIASFEQPTIYEGFDEIITPVYFD